MTYFNYWGKTNKAGEYHLLVYHCLDVAAVGKKLLESHQGITSFFCEIFELSPEELLNWLPFLLALHDIGKFSDGFQQLVPELAKNLGRSKSKKTYPIRHDPLGFILWDIIKKNFPEKIQESISNTAPAIFGHHGKPVSSKDDRSLFSEENENNAKEFIQNLKGMFLVNLEEIPKIDRKWTWWLAGFVSMCDWLGSDQTFFKFYGEEIPLETYWNKIAMPSAKAALKASGLRDASPSDSKHFGDLFPRIDYPTPLQEKLCAIPLENEPQLFILEDVTGAGKTEAALMLAHRLMVKGLGEGIYIGLPTMATSDAMYERVASVYRQFFSKESMPSLVLAHGARDQNETFLNSIMTNRLDKEELSTAAFCNYWVSNNRKKALLADFGVGTIDQALLAILQTKYQCLRLWGLRHKILILDEVHASDAYMHELTCALLRFHRASGGSAILLSATLPKKMKVDLVQSFYGRKRAPESVKKIVSKDYPLLTSWSNISGINETKVETRDSLKRTLQWSIYPDRKQLLQQLLEKLNNGQCAAWICNTVTDAIALYNEAIQSNLAVKSILFHARFAMGDRLEIQANVMQRFGPDSRDETRAGKLVIATQVIEQSLDLDFDWMVSDLAPIDLLIQRAGRLRRHVRDQAGNPEKIEQRGPVEFWIQGPQPNFNCDKNWYKTPFKSAAFVYEDHVQLWKTAHYIHEHPSFQVPERMREAIETVFGENSRENVPETLLPSAEKKEGADFAAGQLGRINTIALDAGYSADYGWEEDVKIPTRLSTQPTQVIRLARWENGQLQPWCEHKEAKKAWAQSEVSVSLSKIAQESSQSILKQAIDTLKATWPGKPEYYCVIPLWQNSDGQWIGTAKNAKGEKISLRYDREVGLMYE